MAGQQQESENNQLCDVHAAAHQGHVELQGRDDAVLRARVVLFTPEAGDCTDVERCVKRGCWRRRVCTRGTLGGNATPQKFGDTTKRGWGCKVGQYFLDMALTHSAGTSRPLKILKKIMCWQD